MLDVIKRAGQSIHSLPPGSVTSGFSSSYSRLPSDEPANTITVKFQSPASSKCIHPTQDRTITPREAARIQSFDDDYVFRGPMTHIAAQLGNAVPPLLGRAISTAISPHLMSAQEGQGSLKCLSLFSSAGIGELGVEATGIEIVVASELRPDRCGLYRANHPGTDLLEGDIWDLRGEIVSRCRDRLGSRPS